MFKMYFLVKDSIDNGHAITSVAHGSIMCYKKFIDDPDMIKWNIESFRKVVCKVNDKQFEKAKEYGNYVIVTESGLGGIEVAIVFCPGVETKEGINFFKSLPLWK